MCTSFLLCLANKVHHSSNIHAQYGASILGTLFSSCVILSVSGGPDRSVLRFPPRPRFTLRTQMAPTARINIPTTLRLPEPGARFTLAKRVQHRTRVEGFHLTFTGATGASADGFRRLRRAFLPLITFGRANLAGLPEKLASTGRADVAALALVAKGASTSCPVPSARLALTGGVQC